MIESVSRCFRRGWARKVEPELSKFSEANQKSIMIPDGDTVEDSLGCIKRPDPNRTGGQVKPKSSKFSEANRKPAVLGSGTAIQ